MFTVSSLCQAFCSINTQTQTYITPPPLMALWNRFVDKEAKSCKIVEWNLNFALLNSKHLICSTSHMTKRSWVTCQIPGRRTNLVSLLNSFPSSPNLAHVLTVGYEKENREKLICSIPMSLPLIPSCLPSQSRLRCSLSSFNYKIAQVFKF